MSRRGQSPDEPELFDLPLEPESPPSGKSPEEPDDEPPAPELEEESGETLFLFEEEDPERVEEPETAPQSHLPRPEQGPSGAAPRERLRAGLADLAVALAVLAAAIIGSRLMGVPLSLEQWLPLALLQLVFTFLYFVVPLAFWGRTPGMTLAGLVSRSRDGLPLTFSQTVLRWAAAQLTVLLLGLPLLLLLRGPSLADRMSGSVTHGRREG